MTLQEIQQLMDDTRRSARVEDKMQQATALGTLEIARQLTILNDTLKAKNGAPKAKGKAAGKR